MKHNTTQHKIDKFKALIQKGLKAWTRIQTPAPTWLPKQG
jgi:hypothetical protein